MLHLCICLVFFKHLTETSHIPPTALRNSSYTTFHVSRSCQNISPAPFFLSSWSPLTSVPSGLGGVTPPYKDIQTITLLSIPSQLTAYILHKNKTTYPPHKTKPAPGTLCLSKLSFRKARLAYSPRFFPSVFVFLFLFLFIFGVGFLKPPLFYQTFSL